VKIRRTLLTAGVFALLAMIYVPTPAQRFVHPGYRFIFSSEDTSIAFFQLLPNAGFAALLGAATCVPWKRYAVFAALQNRAGLFELRGSMCVY
jgi:hypothetical protein